MVNREQVSGQVFIMARCVAVTIASCLQRGGLQRFVAHPNHAGRGWGGGITINWCWLKHEKDILKHKQNKSTETCSWVEVAYKGGRHRRN